MGRESRANKNSRDNTKHEPRIKTTISQARDLARIGRPETLAAILVAMRSSQRKHRLPTPVPTVD